jgi:hypothetical protein
MWDRNTLQCYKVFTLSCVTGQQSLIDDEWSVCIGYSDAALFFLSAVSVIYVWPIKIKISHSI